MMERRHDVNTKEDLTIATYQGKSQSQNFQSTEFYIQQIARLFYNQVIFTLKYQA